MRGAGVVVVVVVVGRARACGGREVGMLEVKGEMSEGAGNIATAMSSQSTKSTCRVEGEWHWHACHAAASSKGNGRNSCRSVAEKRPV